VPAPVPRDLWCGLPARAGGCPGAGRSLGRRSCPCTGGGTPAPGGLLAPMPLAPTRSSVLAGGTRGSMACTGPPCPLTARPRVPAAVGLCGAGTSEPRLAPRYMHTGTPWLSASATVVGRRFVWGDLKYGFVKHFRAGVAHLPRPAFPVWTVLSVPAHPASYVLKSGPWPPPLPAAFFSPGTSG